jgi:DNA-binding transcriptional regulator YiaG
MAQSMSSPDVIFIHLPGIQGYPSDKIIALRKKIRLSQAASVPVANASLSTRRNGERGVKKLPAHLGVY